MRAIAMEAGKRLKKKENKQTKTLENPLKESVEAVNLPMQGGIL